MTSYWNLETSIRFEIENWTYDVIVTVNMTSSSKVMRYQRTRKNPWKTCCLYYRIACDDDVILKFRNEHSIQNWKVNTWRHRYHQYDVIVTSYEISKNQEELMKTLLYLIWHNLWLWRHIEISKRKFDLKLKTK